MVWAPLLERPEHRAGHPLRIGPDSGERHGTLVPWTTVIGSRVAPFSFGPRTGEAEVRIRPCPALPCPTEPEHGLHSTFKGWRDPYRFPAWEDPAGDRIASVLRRDAAIIGGDGALVIEGRSGKGDRLMLGDERLTPG